MICDRTKRRGAFTLIEVMMVVVLVGLLAGGVVFGFSRPLREMRARQAVEELRGFDAAARQAARRSGREVSIVFDLSAQRIMRVESGGARDRTRQTAAMSPALRIERIRTANRTHSTGRVSVRCASGGLSQSYAMRLAGDDGDRWLVVAGFSGQLTEVNDETQVQAILSRATARRNTD